MKIENKLEKVTLLAKQAEEKLIALATKKAKKKKILKAVDEIQTLTKKKSKLNKKVKAATTKVIKEQPQVKTATKTSSDKVKEEVVKAAPKVTAKQAISTELSAKDAITKIAEMEDVAALKSFITGEQRKTVLDRAATRANALTK